MVLWSRRPGQPPRDEIRRQKKQVDRDNGDADGDELTPEMLAQFLKQMQLEGGGAAEQGPPATNKGDIVLSQNQANRALADEDWRVKVVSTKGDAVCKIITHIVQFDFEMPFKPADDAQAIGTGFFVDLKSANASEELIKSGDKFVVTNAHVIESAAKVWITTPKTGEERFDAVVCGVCFDIDLCVLKIRNCPDTPTISLGDSNKVLVGQSVVALGHPLGMNSLKLTEGVISGREDGLFQTDTALNPGNSGGPMLNHQGELIGVNVAIAENSNNVGFAIPSFHLLSLFDALATRPKHAKVLFKPVLGCAVTNTSPALMRWSGADANTTGVLVSEVMPNFPMYNAGVREGDILTSFDGNALDNFGEAKVSWSSARAPLDSLIGLLTQESKPEITYVREGKSIKTTLSFEDPKCPGYPILPRVREYHPPYESIDFETVFGFVFMGLTVNHLEIFHQNEMSAAILRSLTPIIADPEKASHDQLIVSAVLGGSLSSKVDVIDAGAVVESVNGRPVATLSDLRKAVLVPELKYGRYYFTMKTKDKKLLVLPIGEALASEEELSDLYKFRISELVVALSQIADIRKVELEGMDHDRFSRHLSRASKSGGIRSPRVSDAEGGDDDNNDNAHDDSNEQRHKQKKHHTPKK